jgi:hypothetical protein
MKTTNLQMPILNNVYYCLEQDKILKNIYNEKKNNIEWLISKTTISYESKMGFLIFNANNNDSWELYICDNEHHKSEWKKTHKVEVTKEGDNIRVWSNFNSIRDEFPNYKESNFCINGLYRKLPKDTYLNNDRFKEWKKAQIQREIQESDAPYIVKEAEITMNNKGHYIIKSRYLDHKFQSYVNLNISSNTVFAGSMPLQILLGKKWSGSDIDIFTSGFREDRIMDQLISNRKFHFYSQLEKNIYNNGYKDNCVVRRIYDEHKYKDIMSQTKNYSTYKGYKDICGIHTYKCKDNDYQFIIMDCKTNEDVIDSIMTHFDFSFCKVVYHNGKFIVGCSLIDLFNQVGDIEIKGKYPVNLAKRFAKYTKRGFKIRGIGYMPFLGNIKTFNNKVVEHQKLEDVKKCETTLQNTSYELKNNKTYNPAIHMTCAETQRQVYREWSKTPEKEISDKSQENIKNKEEYEESIDLIDSYSVIDLPSYMEY